MKKIFAAHAASIVEKYLHAKKVQASVVAIKDISHQNEPLAWPSGMARFALTWTRSPREGWVIDVNHYELHSERSKAATLLSCTFQSSKMELLLIMHELHDILSMCEEIGIDETLKYLQSHIRVAQAMKAS